MKYVHHADLTCFVQNQSFEAGHRQIERYTFPFSGPAEMLKTSIKSACQAALESRRNRGLSTGRLHVELDEDNPGSGRVIDHIPRDATGNLFESVMPAIRVSHPTKQSAKSEPSTLAIPISVSKEQVTNLLELRNVVNASPFEVDGQLFEAGCLQYVNVGARMVNGLYVGHLHFQPTNISTAGKPFEFSRLPGLPADKEYESDSPPDESAAVSDDKAPEQAN